jgi:hypothetical protein
MMDIICSKNQAHHASSYGWSPAAVALLAKGLLKRPLLADGRCHNSQLEITLSENEKKDEKRDNYRIDIRRIIMNEFW